MVIYANGARLPEGSPVPEKGMPCAIFIGIDTLSADAETLGLTHLLIPPVDESAANRFEARSGYECILLNIPDKSADIEAPPLNVDIYYTMERVLFVHDPIPAVDKLQTLLVPNNGNSPLPFDRVLSTFFNLLTEKDSLYLEEIEESIASLEDDIAEDASEDYLVDISTLRKTLLKQKRYFESLLDTIEDAEENPSGFLTDDQIRLLHIIANRADRQLHSVLNLRDYVTQVREAYQAQIDISLNKTMKLFTVITAIFLPLTLVAGWYGMNLQMPEYLYPYMYPIVIIVSVAIVLLCIVYFKKNKWF